MSYQGHQILIDPYFTRPGLRDMLPRRGLVPSREIIQRHVEGPVDAVLVGHTHFDHALDVPEIARIYQPTVYGSRSMANLMRASGLERQGVEVEPHRAYEVGPFEVTFVPSLHSKLLLGLAVPWDGDIDPAPAGRLGAADYRCGQVYAIHISVAGTNFYHQGSANLIEDELEHSGVDYFLAAISGRGFTADYVARVLRVLAPRTVVPHHYDNFLRPLDAPVELSFNVGLSRFIDEVQTAQPGVEVRTLEVLETIGG